VNPAAAAGKALHRVGEIGERCGATISPTRSSSRASGARDRARRAARGDGVDVIAVAGGDGTIGEVAQAYLGPDGAPIKGPDLAVIPCGTGGDFRKTLGMSGALDEAVARIRLGTRRPLDLGIVRLVGEGGIDVVRAFVNVASFGISGPSTRSSTPGRSGSVAGGVLHGDLARHGDVSKRRRAGESRRADLLRGARVQRRHRQRALLRRRDDDRAARRSRRRALRDRRRRRSHATRSARLSAKIYRGAHLAADGVRVTSGMSVDAEPVHAWASVLADVDGEQTGRLPLRADIAKGAITLRA